MPFASKEKQRAYNKNRYDPTRRSQYHINARGKDLARSRAWYAGHADDQRKQQRELKSQRKFIVLSHYSGSLPRCACCDEERIEFLTINHLNGGGNAHRRTMTTNFYLWLIQNDFPKDFNVLCLNCNFAQGHSRDGLCPHERERELQSKRINPLILCNA